MGQNKAIVELIKKAKATSKYNILVELDYIDMKELIKKVEG